MAAHAIDQETWEKILQALRDDPDRNVTEAGRKAGVTYPTAKRAYREGYPNAHPPRPPIEKILHEETIAARAAMQGTIEDESRRQALEDEARKRAEAEKARKDAVEARRQEASMVRSQRGNVLGLISVSANVIQGALKLGTTIKRELEEAAADPSKMTLEQKFVALTRAGLLTQRIASAAMDVVKMERLLLGEPTEILGTRNLDQVGFEEALKELRSGAEVAARIAERRQRREKFKLTVLEGGKGKKKGQAA